MNDKEKLKRLLLRMYILARDGEVEKIKKYDGEFNKLYAKVFGANKPLTKESGPFDRARNNIIMSRTKRYEKLGPYRDKFLNAALKEINEIKTE